MTFQTSLIIILFTSFWLINAQTDITSPYKCIKNENEDSPLFLDVQEDMSAATNNDGRTLASYANIRMIANYDRLSSAPSAYKTYLSTKLIPPILSYWQAALKIKYPVVGTLKLPTSTKTMCNGATPKALFTGVTADYYYIVESDYSADNGVLASSYACYLATTSKRPIIASTTFNRVGIVATTDVLLHERNMICTMHEMVHTFGFTTTLFPYFLDNNGKTLTGHIKSAILDGSTAKVLNLAPLTSRIRAFFGCSTIIGAYLEDDGGSGTAGVHFEKRQFPFEVMSSGLLYQMAVSQFTLAFLEGTGWFVPDYTYADPYWFGQNDGCNFLTKSCSSSTFKFNEFCDSAVNDDADCTVTGRGGGVCTVDALSNNCEFYHPYIGYDCENTDSSNYARLPTIQTFGRGKGSKCFSGTLSSSSSSASRATFCFKYTCSGTGASTKVTVGVGSTNVVCTAKGTKTVAGYKGSINCPDPQTFCSTVGVKACPRNCMGRGTCNSGVCTCNKGFSGTDCALTA